MQKFSRKNLDRLKKDPAAYGGELYKTRKGRARPRPIYSDCSIHLVLRSELARGKWSFQRFREPVEKIIHRFARKHAVRIHSTGLVGNHIHLHLQASKVSYIRFIRAITCAIAMLVTNASRLKPLTKRFWALRPFTRVIRGARAFQTIKDYVRLNQLQGYGLSRAEALFNLAWEKPG